MNVFLEELSQEFNDDFILIMDGAGWHKSKDLQIPKNIQIIILPPYCPELNCVESLWKYVKDNNIKRLPWVVVRVIRRFFGSLGRMERGC
jgi:transposase